VEEELYIKTHQAGSHISTSLLQPGASQGLLYFDVC